VTGKVTGGCYLVPVQPIVMVEGVAHIALVLPPLPLSRLIGPIGLAVAEEFVQGLARIFLVELLAVIRGAGIPAVAAQRVVLARHAQLVHGAVHRIEWLLRLGLARAEISGVGSERQWKEYQKEKDKPPCHVNASAKSGIHSSSPREATRRTVLSD